MQKKISLFIVCMMLATSFVGIFVEQGNANNLSSLPTGDNDGTQESNPSDLEHRGLPLEQYTLTIFNQGAGMVMKDPDYPSYTYGTTVELTAYPVPGYWHFDHWEGDVSDTYANPTTITMYENEIVTAYFLQDELTLTIDIIGEGIVLKYPDQETYHFDDIVQLTAIPEPGWSFVEWGGDHSGSENPTNITIFWEMTITATFTQDQYTLTINIDGNGTVQKNPNQQTYTYGTPVQLTAHAAPRWYFDHWTGDLQGNANPATIIMDRNKAVTAYFVFVNHPPETPLMPSGPVKGIAGSEYSYSTRAIDPDGDPIQYGWDWNGDCIVETWTSYVPSGTQKTVYNIWNEQGIYEIRVKAQDTYDLESNWSMPLTVRMYTLGDINGDDHQVNFGDINPFVLALTAGEAGYYNAYPNGYYYTADCNLDGQVNFGDINPFVALLTRAK